MAENICLLFMIPVILKFAQESIMMAHPLASVSWGSWIAAKRAKWPLAYVWSLSRDGANSWNVAGYLARIWHSSHGVLCTHSNLWNLSSPPRSPFLLVVLDPAGCPSPAGYDTFTQWLNVSLWPKQKLNATWGLGWEVWAQLLLKKLDESLLKWEKTIHTN